MVDSSADAGKWKEIVRPDNSIWRLPLKEIWNYRDLLVTWMRRDILSIYKQTILGPVWFLVQPILTTITYIIIFSRVGKFSTTGLPPVLFYLSGIILWGYFAESLTKISTFFKDNGPVVSKVYFPRLIIPLSLVLTNLVKFSIQFGLFLGVFGYYSITTTAVHPNLYLLLFPLLILLTAGFGFGAGLIISSLTTRYKDLIHLTSFGVQLLMFLSSVFFSVSDMEDGLYKKVILANPMTGIIEAFRYGFTGKGYLSWELLAYDASCIGVLLFISILVFNSVEKSFVDTI
ncbi:MAG: ABC transporter permease [Chitinophagaceae bacterium]